MGGFVWINVASEKDQLWVSEQVLRRNELINEVGVRVGAPDQ
jgi:hypothetical protein